MEQAGIMPMEHLSETGSLYISPCVSCNGSTFAQLPYFYEYLGRRHYIVQCKKCSLGTLYPMLIPDEVNSLYNAEYFESDYHCGVLKGTYAEEVDGLREEFRPSLSLIKKHCHGERFLEIGCAGGAMLAEARDSGFETVGVELSEEMAEWGRANLHLDIRSGTLEQQRFPDNSFDVIFLGDVIEHLLNPLDVLKEIYRVLAPAGIIAVAYPMELNHIVPRLRKAFQLQKRSPFKPYHLFYYNPSALAQLLRECRFEVEITDVHKMVRDTPLVVRLLDSLNYVVTRASGLFGDRGFTIARKK